MDADTLRLILIVAGGLFLAGLYLWERRRAERGRRRHRPAAESAPRERPEQRREPQLGPWEESDDEAPEALSTAGAVGAEPPAPQGPPEPAPPAGPVILQLHVAAAEGRLDGAAIVRAAGLCGLEPGEMDIFHRYDGEKTQTPLFSMANMLKPGTFPFGAMAGFETPGVTLFSQAEGEPGDPERLDTMLATAYALAAELDGQVLDDRRQPLTEDAEARLRDRVAALVERSASAHSA
jgi:cell division protein ZipA